MIKLVIKGIGIGMLLYGMGILGTKFVHIIMNIDITQMSILEVLFIAAFNFFFGIVLIGIGAMKNGSNNKP